MKFTTDKANRKVYATVATFKTHLTMGVLSRILKGIPENSIRKRQEILIEHWTQAMNR